MMCFDKSFKTLECDIDGNAIRGTLKADCVNSKALKREGNGRLLRISGCGGCE